MLSGTQLEDSVYCFVFADIANHKIIGYIFLDFRITVNVIQFVTINHYSILSIRSLFVTNDLHK